MNRSKLLSALLAALLILGIAAPGAAEVNRSTHPLVDPQELVPGRSADDVVNILLLGSEHGAEGQSGPSAGDSKAAKARELGIPKLLAYHTDTIMVLSINKTKKQINLISIPRDTLVYVPGVYGMYKMNDAFNCASSVREGISRAQNTVRWLLGGVKIDAYVLLDMDALVKLSDTLGGVDFDLEEEFTGTSGRKYSPGRQHLDSQGIMDYVRARKSIDGSDQNRTERSRKMIAAIIAKLWGNWDLVNTLWETTNGKNINFYTNIEASELTTLYRTAQELGRMQIGSYAIEGEYGTHTTCGDFQFRLLDQDNRIRVLEEAFGISAEPLPYMSLKFLRWMNEDYLGVAAEEANEIRFSNDGFCIVKRLHKGQMVLAQTNSLGDLTAGQKAAVEDFERIYNDYLAAFEAAADRVNSGDGSADIPRVMTRNYESALKALADQVGYTKSLQGAHGHFWEQDYAINQYYQIDWR
ncbi:MAG: LCP family protein [Clostridiales bacterium]|nr:LCP family protein [Clostridiales bacterium]